MSRAQQVAVIGLGRFGTSMCAQLEGEGVEVLAVDLDEKRVSDHSGIATHVVQGDSTDERVLEELDIASFDTVVVAIGENLQASILTALLVKQAGATNIWAKAHSEYHAKVLDLVGVDRVVQPERDMGQRIARLLASESMLDFIDLDDNHSLVELLAGRGIIGRTLRELDVRAKYGCTIVGYRRADVVIISPDPDYRIEEGDILFVIGATDGIAEFERQAAR